MFGSGAEVLQAILADFAAGKSPVELMVRYHTDLAWAVWADVDQSNFPLLRSIANTGRHTRFEGRGGFCNHALYILNVLEVGVTNYFGIQLPMGDPEVIPDNVRAALDSGGYICDLRHQYKGIRVHTRIGSDTGILVDPADLQKWAELSLLYAGHTPDNFDRPLYWGYVLNLWKEWEKTDN